MTDKEIINNLECCISYGGNCNICPICSETCVEDNLQNALNLIKKQQKQLDDKCDRCIARDRAEAIKEFAEKLKSSFVLFVNLSNGIGCMNITTKEIDDLVKEMVGDENDL